jgi:hypothetical protein
MVKESLRLDAIEVDVGERERAEFALSPWGWEVETNWLGRIPQKDAGIRYVS